MDNRKLPLWKNILYAVITVCLFFGALEVILALAGVKPFLAVNDPYVGFSGSAPLFSEQETPDGRKIYATSPAKLTFFNYQDFPREKGRNTYRVFTLGGSTTYGRPYDDATSFSAWLRELLATAEPDRTWEVINCGGMSYASYRVAALMEELLNYEPDLFIVYTGHNEFLEHRTYSGIIQMPDAVIGTGELLGRTRTFSAIKKVVDKARGEQDKSFQLDSEVDEILNTTIGPESYSRDDQLSGQITAHFRFNLERMAAMARAAGSRIIFVNPAVNLKDMSPFKSEFAGDLGGEDRSRVAALIDKGKQKQQDKDHEAALKAFDEALSVDSRHAGLLYLKAQSLFAMNRMDEAREYFIRASDEDVCPLRILTPMRGAVKDTAAKYQVPLLDFEKLLSKKVLEEYGAAIPGKEYFLDHVHLTIEGYRMLGIALFEQLLEMRIVSPSSSWGDEAIEGVTAKVMSGVDARKNAMALRNLAKVLGWAGKLDEAHALFLLSREELGDDPEILSELSRSAARRGNIKEAIDYLQKALSAPEITGEAVLRRIMADLLEREGRRDEALSQYYLCYSIVKGKISQYSRPDLVVELAGLNSRQMEERIYKLPEHLQMGLLYVDVNARMAQIFASEKNFSEAAKHYREVLSLMPEKGDVHGALGTILAIDGKEDEAEKHLEKALALNPGSPGANHSLALLYDRQGKLDQAESQYREVIRLDPDAAQPHNNLGVVYARQGKLDEAVKEFYEALRLDPQNREARVNLNNALMQQGGKPAGHPQFR